MCCECEGQQRESWLLTCSRLAVGRGPQHAPQAKDNGAVSPAKWNGKEAMWMAMNGKAQVLSAVVLPSLHLL
jgi:hypothetical protein